MRGGGVTRQSCPLVSAHYSGKAEEDGDPGVQPQPRMQLNDRWMKRGGGLGERRRGEELLAVWGPPLDRAREKDSV